MKRIRACNRKREYIYIFLFLLLFAFVLVTLFTMPQAEIVHMTDAYGQYDLSQNSFDHTIYRISKEAWESWPEKLYAPDDLADAEVAGQARLLDGEAYQTLDYATHRLRLQLKPGVLYGIKLKSSDYAMRIYIDGTETGSIGVPGATRAETVPRVQNCVYYFRADTGETEIVIQAANFVHAADGAWPPDIHIGTQEDITRQNTVGLALSFVTIGYLFTAFFDHLGLFCLNRKRKTTLVFALACLLLALMDKNLLMTLVPDYNWFVAIRFEYIVHFLTFAALTYFLDRLYPKLLNKYIARAYYAVMGLAVLITLCTDTRVFTGLLRYFDVLSIVMIVYIFIRLAMQCKSGGIGSVLSFIGAVVLGLAAINDMLYYQNIQIIQPIAEQYFMTPIGMTFFIFCNSMVVSVEYVDTELALIRERRQLETLALDNAALDKANQMRSDIIATISHESRTPLAVLASYAGLASMELKDRGVDAQIAADLDTIAFEAERVANLIDSMGKLSGQDEMLHKRTVLDIGDLIRQTTRLYEPIAERGEIRLAVDIPAGKFPVFGSPEELTQVVFNLLQNAKNHTKNGAITVRVSNENDWVIATVSDTGSGIAPALLPRIFERGVAGERGGSGIGLFVCREIAENHGGSITADSEAGKGTTMTVALPAHKEGDSYAE